MLCNASENAYSKTMKFPELDALSGHVLAEANHALWTSRHLVRAFSPSELPENPDAYPLTDEKVESLSVDALAKNRRLLRDEQ